MGKAERYNLQEILAGTSDNDVALQFLEALPVAAVVLDADDKDVLWATSHCRELFNIPDDGDLSLIKNELVRSPDHARNLRDKLKQDGRIQAREAVVMTADNRLIVVLMDLGLVELNGKMHLAFCLQDITERKEAEAELCHDAEADKLMSNISGQLLGIDIANAISDSLRNLGIYLNVDRVALAPLTDESSVIRARQWISDRIDGENPGIHTIPLPSLRWIEQSLNKGKAVLLNKLDDLPSEAALDRDILEETGLKALQVHPIMFQRSLIGLVTMECYTEDRQWTSRESDLLTQFCNVIGSAIARQQAERRTRHAMKRAEGALKALEGAQSQLIHAEKMAALGDLVAGIAHETSTPLGSAVTTTSALRARTKQLARAFEDRTIKRSDMEINTEPGALSQVITNLMTNALIHAFDNDLSSKGRIGIEVHQAGDELRLAFTDNGKGMTPEVREKLFDPYFTTKRDQGGSGLGMPIIQDLVKETLHGRIIVTSEPGEGSQFHITFPADLTKVVAAPKPGGDHN